jgi:hypothetical protein
MAVVAVLAVLVWGAMMGLQSYHYYERASLYDRWERQWREIAARDLARGATRSIGARWGLQIADYYAPLARKYRRGMWRPWRPVDPDPPPPPDLRPRPPYLE